MTTTIDSICQNFKKEVKYFGGIIISK